MRIVSRVISPLSLLRVSLPLHHACVSLIFVMDAWTLHELPAQTLDSIHASDCILAWESVRRLKSLRPVIFCCLSSIPDDFAQCHPRLDLRDRLQLLLCRKVWRSEQWNFGVIGSFIFTLKQLEGSSRSLRIFG
jgi:hypothetical protein